MARPIALLLVAALAGCGDDDPHHDHDHHHDDHDHAPKYGGHLVEIGDHLFQVELVLDKETGKLTAYVWDGHVERPVRLAMKTLTVHCNGKDRALLPVADPLTGEKVGDTARFEATFPDLKGATELEGSVGALDIGDTTFAATAFRFGE